MAVFPLLADGSAALTLLLSVRNSKELSANTRASKAWAAGRKAEAKLTLRDSEREGELSFVLLSLSFCSKKRRSKLQYGEKG